MAERRRKDGEDFELLEEAVRGPAASKGIAGHLGSAISVTALALSGFNFYATVLKQADLRFYPPPLVYMYRQDFRDVLAIPLTVSNDGARRGTILSFDLEVTDLQTTKSKRFQNLHFGASPTGPIRLFTPVTVAGGGTFTDVVIFHALEPGSFVETTGGVKLPLRLTLKMNLDPAGAWPTAPAPAPVTFDMTASYIASLNAMERGQPTQLHDERWTGAKEEAGK